MGGEAPEAEAATLTARGDALRASRAWADARTCYERALAIDARLAAAWEGLGLTARYLDDLDRSRPAFEAAYREYLDAGDRRGAARAAMEIALHHDLYRAEHVIANGWFERAGALLEHCPDAPERAWLSLWRAHVHIHVRDEVQAGRQALAEAVRINAGCQVGEIDTMARGLTGLALISDGDVETGLRRLDEATAAAVADSHYRPEAAGFACCYVLGACETVRDFDRAWQWLEQAGATNRALRVPHFASLCRSHYIAVLTWRGDYAAAEEEIAAMRGELSPIAPGWMCHCDIRLGEVRRRQGRDDEAAALLGPNAAQPLALLPLAWLRLDAGEAGEALGLVDRYLRRIGNDSTRTVHALDLVVRAAALAGDEARVRAALGDLRYLARRVNTHIARGVLAEAEASDPDAAADARRVSLEDAIDEYDLGGAPYEAAAARIRLAATLASAGHAEGSLRVLEVGRATAERIGAMGLVRRTSCLPGRAAAGAAPPQPDTVLSRREREVLALVAQGLSNQDIGERLFVSPFTVKRHVANILEKLDLPSRAAAASYAVREGLAR